MKEKTELVNNIARDERGGLQYELSDKGKI